MRLTSAGAPCPPRIPFSRCRLHASPHIRPNAPCPPCMPQASAAAEMFMTKAMGALEQPGMA